MEQGLLEQRLNFLFEIDKLKSVLRQTKLYDDSRFENSAEHSWHLALAVMTFHDKSNVPVDLTKCLKMALVHDLVEIYTGDTFLYHEGHDDNAEEAKAAEKIFSIIDDLPLMLELKTLWFEFEARQTPEAKFVKALDRFLPLTQNWKTHGTSWKKHGIRYSQVVEKNAYIQDGSELLWQQALKIFEECRVAGNLLE
ncbi:HD domain-containing protein [bacterium]|nr:HD domain-containing protein [bacterium]